MVVVSTNGQMGEDIKGSTAKTRRKVLAFSHGQTTEATKVTGNRAVNTGSAALSKKMVIREWRNGLLAKDWHGEMMRITMVRIKFQKHTLTLIDL
mmetsp:Transcript_6014/g.9798  ORF Transcript_6014/g.9798 Transcript_6014/m.9798 type:complete len:95 (-) Transcript_6014:42-326(-)